MSFPHVSVQHVVLCPSDPAATLPCQEAFPDSQGQSAECRSPCAHCTSRTELTTLCSNDLSAHLSHPPICQLCKLFEGETHVLITFAMPAPSIEPGTELTPQDCLLSE